MIGVLTVISGVRRPGTKKNRVVREVSSRLEEISQRTTTVSNTEFREQWCPGRQGGDELNDHRLATWSNMVGVWIGEAVEQGQFAVLCTSEVKFGQQEKFRLLYGARSGLSLLCYPFHKQCFLADLVVKGHVVSGGEDMEAEVPGWRWNSRPLQSHSRDGRGWSTK